jgi:uncharacterized protein (TIGR03437 family)
MRIFTFVAFFVLTAPLPAQILAANKILSGNGVDVASAIAADVQGDVFVAGTTTSIDFPVVNGLAGAVVTAALYVSTDGHTFIGEPRAPSNIQQLAASADGRTLLAADLSGAIFRSSDGGATWSGRLATLAGNVEALTIDPLNDSNAYAVVSSNAGANPSPSASSFFYRSTDGGATWKSQPAPSGGVIPVSRILFDPRNSAGFYVVFSAGLYHSLDNGSTWQLVTLPNPPFPGAIVTARLFAIAPSQPQTIYASTNNGPGQKSTDGGATWQAIADLSPTTPNTVAVDPQDPNTVWVADFTGIERSTDGGASFQSVVKRSGVSWQSLAIDPKNSMRVYVADQFNLYVSLDGGATWNIDASGNFTGAIATPAGIYAAAGSILPTLFLAKLDSTLANIQFSTLIGPAQASGLHLAVDGSGNALITGVTQSVGFPTTSNAIETKFNGPSAGFAVKVRGDGSSLVYSTLFNTFTPGSAALDANGNAVIVGAAQPGAAVSANAYQRQASTQCVRPNVGLNIIPPKLSVYAYAMKLSPDGSSMIYGTYFSGACGDKANAVALDAAGNAYVTGITYSPDFPLTANAMMSAFPPAATLTSAFVSELSADGSKLIYSSFLGGGELNSGNAIALDARGNVFVGGMTQQHASPGALAAIDACAPQIIIGPAIDQSFEHVDGFVAKLALNGSQPAFFATAGGACQDSVQSLALDGAGDVWVAGTTASSDFPLVAPIGAFGPGTGGFAAEIDPSGSKLLFSTFTGGSALTQSSAVTGARTGAYIASSVALSSKQGNPAALAALVDGAQPLAIQLNAAQPVTSITPLVEPFFSPPAVVPGELMILTGIGMGPATETKAQLTSARLFPTNLAGVQVSFNGIAAPLIAVQANRIECQAPFKLDGSSVVNIQVTDNGQTSNQFAAQVVAQQIWPLAVSNADGTPNSASNPAAVGSVVTLYLNGLGQTTPVGIDGGLNSGLILPRIIPQVSANASPAQPVYFGGAPGESTAVFQLNLVAPPLFGTSPTDFIQILGGGIANITLYVK